MSLKGITDKIVNKIKKIDSRAAGELAAVGIFAASGFFNPMGTGAAVVDLAMGTSLTHDKNVIEAPATKSEFSKRLEASAYDYTHMASANREFYGGIKNDVKNFFARSHDISPAPVAPHHPQKTASP